MRLMLTFIKMCCTASHLCRCRFHFFTFLKSSWKMGRMRTYVYAYVYVLRETPANLDCSATRRVLKFSRNFREMKG